MDLEGLEQLPIKMSKLVRVIDDLLGTSLKYDLSIKKRVMCRKLTKCSHIFLNRASLLDQPCLIMLDQLLRAIILYNHTTSREKLY